MRKIRWSMNNGLVRSTIYGEFEVEDGTSEDEINDLVVDEMWGRINLWWDEVDGNSD